MERPTARAIVLDDLGRVLLFKIEDETTWDPDDPSGPDVSRVYWITPGGGVEAGETFEDAARRELWEETGWESVALGPCLFERETVLRVSGRDVLFQERYFLVRVTTAGISLRGFSALEQAVYRDHRWWELEAVETTDEIIFPTELPAILRRALAR